MKKCNDCGKENTDEATSCVECGSTELISTTGGSAASPRDSTDDTESREPWEKVALVENEVEAERLDVELSNQNIPHIMRSYRDSAWADMYQFSKGWGEVEAPNERKNQVLSILHDIRAAEQQAPADND
jgi:hypothetical protein